MADGDAEPAAAQPRGDVPLESMLRHGSARSLRALLSDSPPPKTSKAAAHTRHARFGAGAHALACCWSEARLRGRT
jgi:hypothetical protein